MLNLLIGNCLDILPTLDANSIQTCVTSPPYYNQRDYGTAAWHGGDPACDHCKPLDLKSIASSGLHRPAQSSVGHCHEGYKGRCPRCGATRIDQQIGMEQSPVDYVDKLVTVFHEIKRVLRDDGTVWLNLGDSYATSGTREGNRNGNIGASYRTGYRQRPQGYKPKDLLMIPARVAIALQNDGWYLRSDIIWHKLSVMPESVRDRCTSCYEHVFMLAKQQRYYFDAKAIAEPTSPISSKRYGYAFSGDPPGLNRTNSLKRPEGMREHGETRNCRNLWTINNKPYKAAHHASMPVELAERCILAGSRVGDTVLDPFGGVGTTAYAAIKHGRDAVLIELNPAYAKIARNRLAIESNANR